MVPLIDELMTSKGFVKDEGICLVTDDGVGREPSHAFYYDKEMGDLKVHCVITTHSDHVCGVKIFFDGRLEVDDTVTDMEDFADIFYEFNLFE
jgi:hypothetical protein